MAEKPPSFIVSDRRKFTIEGDLRDESAPPAAEETTPAPIAEATEPPPGPRLVTQPPPPAEPAEPAEVDEEGAIPEPTAQESAEQHAAYQQSSEQLDSMLRQANPGMGPSAAVNMEQIVQSMYISAVVAMGAATEPGQK